MSSRYQNGFDWLQTGASNASLVSLLQAEGWYLRGQYTGALASCTVVTGRYGYGKRLFFNQVGDGGNRTSSFVVRPTGPGGHTVSGFISAGLNIGGDSVAFPILGVYDQVNDVVLCCFQFAANGVVKAYVGGSPNHGGVFKNASDPGSFNDGADIDAECFFNIDNATGEMECRIDTKSVLHLTNIDTQPGSLAYFDSIFWGWDGPGSIAELDFKIDDFRFYDTAGMINNAFLGTCRVQTSFAAGAGATTDFSVFGASSNWQGVLNLNVDDTKYVYDPTVSDYDLYTLTPLVNSPTVFSVQVTAFARQDDATQLTFKNRISSGGTQADGSAFLTAQTYTADHDMWEIDPNTGLTFTGAAVNALQIGPLLYASA